MRQFAAIEAGIRQLHARYTDAVWRKDAAAFAACFASDGEWRISGMVLTGRMQIEQTIAAIFAKMHRVLITFRTPLLDISGGAITARTMIDERVAWTDGNTNVSIGRYYERFVEEDGRWLFAWRLFELHYRGSPDLTGDWFEHPDYGPPPAMPPLDAVSLDTSSQRWQLSD